MPPPSIMATATSSSDPKTLHVTDLVQLGFYLCLQSYKDTKFTGHCRKVQFRPLLEFIFFIGNYLLLTDALIKNFQHVTHIVLTLDNQKNAIRGNTASHLISESPTY